MSQLVNDQNANAPAVAREITGDKTVYTAPSIVAGTLIGTPEGEVPVETLRAGDLVLTQDSGPQPLRWIGRRTVVAKGDHAPIRIAAHTFGAHRSVIVSPHQSILIRDSLSELLFGEPEVLVAAQHLLNVRNVTRLPGGLVTYLHLLLDEHQVVFSNGLPTESLLPGTQAIHGFEPVSALSKPSPMAGGGNSLAARRVLRQHEAMVLMSGAMAA